MPIGGTAFFGQNQHPRITTLYLNSLNRHGDPAPGVNVSTEQVSGSIVQPYGGFEGLKFTVTNPWAAEKADPAVGPLYGGIYMYVRFDPLSTIPNQRGQIVFWSDKLNYVVSADYDPATMKGQVAGVTINETLPGYWDFIQIAGIAMVLTTAAGAIGDRIEVAPGNPSTTTIGSGVTENSLGTAVLTAPQANSMSPVGLNIQDGFNF